MRFSLLSFEPYLTFLTWPDLSFKLWKKKKLTINEVKALILDKIKSKYRGENIDYINFTIENTFDKIKTDLKVNNWIDITNYGKLINYSLRTFSDNILNGIEVKSFQEFKFVTLYIEPHFLFIPKLIENPSYLKLFLNNTSNFLREFLYTNYSQIDLHVHGETSYIFSDLFDVILNEFPSFYGELLKLDRNLLYKLDIVHYFIHLVEQNVPILSKEIRNMFLILNEKLLRIFSIKKLNYCEFAVYLVSKLSSSKDNISLCSALVLQVVNEIYASLCFSGKFKGLKQMSENFKHPLKKSYQRIRHKLFSKSKDLVISRALSKYEDKNNYAEIRISPEVESIKYWHRNTKHLNIYFILHYKKFNSFKEISNYSELRKALLNLFDTTRHLFFFFMREFEKGNKEIIERIVGFDAASIEYWTPPWTYRVFFRFWKHFYRYYLNRDLGLTFHAGEDFIDIATGLRYVYEAIYFLNVDRIGHAMSLGVDIERYLFKYQNVLCSPIVYFFHLLWLHHLTHRFEELFKYKFKILEEIERFLKEFSLEYVVRKAYKAFFSNTSINLDIVYRNLGFFNFIYDKAFYKDTFGHLFSETFKSEFPDFTLARLSFNLLKKIYKALNESKSLKKISPLLDSNSLIPEEEQYEMLVIIQRIIRNLVKRKEIYVEVCPSSNIILYNINSFLDHPILSFLKKDPEFPATINTDNPLLLNTTIELELHLTEEILGKKLLRKLIENSKSAKFSKV